MAASSFSAVLLVLALFAATTRAAPAEDEVTSLPGWDGAFPSKQYSGYLDLPGTGKHMHYWAVLSEGDPSTDPVALWLNGGPGCSSVDGYLYEHGPFHVSNDDYSKLEYFNYTWAKHATMIYLEAPAGVGFSYSDDSADYATNDDQAALDNLAAVQVWFKKFPEFASNDFFVTGESYAGVYVPTLAEALLNAVAAGTYTGAPLKGIAVGNGCSGNEIGTCSWGVQSDYYETTYLTALAFTPRSLKDAIAAECDWSGVANGTDTRSDKCKALISKVHDTVGNINIYDVYGECVSGSAAELEGRKQLKAPRIDSKTGKAKPPAWAAPSEAIDAQLAGQSSDSDSGSSRGPNACIDSRAAAAWINQPAVMEALHVVAQPYAWSICGNQISYTSTRPNLPRDTYPGLNEQIRVLVYNGDWDACVPYTDNEAWTEGMGYAVKEPWHAWSYDYQLTGAGQVGGYATTYDTPHGFTFITVDCEIAWTVSSTNKAPFLTGWKTGTT